MSESVKYTWLSDDEMIVVLNQPDRAGTGIARPIQ